jgi:uncharacterized membrane protein HdeD (DUF308 family)
MNLWLSRKFFLSAIALICGSVALFIGKMDAQVYVYLVGTVLSIHGAANVMDKKLNDRQ